MSSLARSSTQVGSALRRHRKAKDMTQSDLAESAGVRQSTISGLENGADGTKLATLMHVLRALDLELIVQERTRGSFDDIEDLF